MPTPAPLWAPPESPPRPPPRAPSSRASAPGQQVHGACQQVHRWPAWDAEAMPSPGPASRGASLRGAAGARVAGLGCSSRALPGARGRGSISARGSRCTARASRCAGGRGSISTRGSGARGHGSPARCGDTGMGAPSLLLPQGLDALGSRWGPASPPPRPGPGPRAAGTLPPQRGPRAWSLSRVRVLPAAPSPSPGGLRAPALRFTCTAGVLSPPCQRGSGGRGPLTPAPGTQGRQGAGPGTEGRGLRCAPPTFGAENYVQGPREAGRP